jgi:N-acetylglutamate synthase-like GNAT family acetyltransferase
MEPGAEEIVIRRAAASDAGAVGDLVHAAYQHYVPRIGRPPVPMTLDYAQVVADGNTWLAERDGRLVGVLVLEHLDDHVLVENLAVLPAAQGSGVGSRLLRQAEDEARARGVRELRLYTHELMTENRAFYPRRGYRETHVAGEPPWRRAFFAKDLADDPADASS